MAADHLSQQYKLCILIFDTSNDRGIQMDDRYDVIIIGAGVADGNCLDSVPGFQTKGFGMEKSAVYRREMGSFVAKNGKCT
jgi:hypothetical protein